ncbi:MAG: erythromycin esterase family protein [Rhodanobacter sp.]
MQQAAAAEVPTAKAPAAKAPHFPGPTTGTIDLNAFGAIVDDAHVVVFGEDSHYMAVIHNLVPQMFEYLVETKHFRVFVFESQWGLSDAFKDFMASDRTTLTPTEDFFLDGAFASRDSTAMLVWIRTFNRAHPRDPILIAGFQPEQPVTDFRDLWAYMQKAAPKDIERLRAPSAVCRAGDAAYKTDADFIAANVKRLTGSKQPVYTAAERADCLAALDAIGAYLGAHHAALVARGTAADAELARLHMESLKTYVASLTLLQERSFLIHDASVAEQSQWQKEAYGALDKARFEIFNSLRDLRYGNRKVFFWMHDWHAAKHASETALLTPTTVGIPAGTISVGERLAAEYGSKLVTIGTLVPCGSTCVEPKDSVEPAFATKFGSTVTLIDLRKSSPTRAGLPFHTPGSIYANFHKLGFNHVLLDRQFDAILYVPASASTI